jgi:hypothetical protein
MVGNDLHGNDHEVALPEAGIVASSKRRQCSGERTTWLASPPSLLPVAQRRRARWGSATRPPRERGLHAGGASGGTRTSWRCRSAEANASMRVQWFFDALNPVTHLEAYERDVAIAFLCGAADLHVPAEAAGRFRTALCDRDPRRPIGCGSSCTWVSTTSTRRGTSGCTRRRSSGWRRAGRRADRTAAEDDGTGSSV